MIVGIVKESFPNETRVAMVPALLPQLAKAGVEVVIDGEREVLFTRSLDPHQVLEDRGWFDVNLSLDDYAGRRIALELATSTALPLGGNLSMGGWGSPTLLVREQGEAR